MTGRGRPRKAKSLDESKTSPENLKPPTLPKSSEKDFSQEKKNDTAKARTPKEQKTTSQTAEKPPVLSPQKETTSHQRTPVATTKAPAKTTKPKTCTDKAKTTQQSDEGIKKTQPETPKDTKKALKDTTKEKSCNKKERPSLKSLEETTKMQPVAPETIKKDSIKGKTAVDSVLHKTLEKLKIKKREQSDASVVVNNLIDNIIAHLKNTQSFAKVEASLRTGSYYENLKISSPDEFDVMLPIPVDRVKVEPFGDDGAFYSVGLKRSSGPLQKFQEADTLSASEMLREFREEVKKCAKKYPEWELTKKKKGCPAVTLNTKVNSVTISLDVVLSIVVKSTWPSFTKDGLRIEGWLGTKVRRDYRLKPYYLVPKYEGRGNVENDGVLAKDVWRVSFSHVEKGIMKNHGSEKTCCEKGGVRCCRKECLKLLKHLLSLLKEKDSSFDKFCSYHAKTTLLHACCSRTKDSDWRVSDLNQCFLQLLEDFLAHLRKGVLQNFFIPSQNLLSGPGQNKCKKLALCISEERDSGFPIFQCQLELTTNMRV
ncbi:cyclic GMP-AMP synthase isoform X1 [Notolabrus celidotus]|uniref:cyclic GMP-AMP synthase isoform X1 n=1 Tax=Notolabrus celidotus TaxID=1203425 RepID=UPI00149052EF|nr:cyclic GMP-AMP synthase isoform X1 [Notolabrus celidotus]